MEPDNEVGSSLVVTRVGCVILVTQAALRAWVSAVYWFLLPFVPQRN